MTAVIPAAVSTISDLAREHVIPTKIENSKVNTMRIGSPYFLTTSMQQPITQLIAIRSTETMINMGVLTNILVKDCEFIAHTHTATVINSCKERSVYTFLMKPFLESP